MNEHLNPIFKEILDNHFPINEDNDYLIKRGTKDNFPVQPPFKVPHYHKKDLMNGEKRYWKSTRKNYWKK